MVSRELVHFFRPSFQIGNERGEFGFTTERGRGWVAGNFFVRFGLRPTREPSAEWNRSMVQPTQR